MSKFFLLILVLLTVISAYPQDKIPLNHKVYDSWKTIEHRSISNNGMWVCYELKPQDGNSSVALYDLKTKTSRYFQNASMPQFSEDNTCLIFRINPLKSTLRKAKKQKLKKSKLPHDSLAILNLNTNTLFKAADIDKIILPEKGSGWILYTSFYTPPADSLKIDHADTSRANQKPARSLIIHKLSNAKEWKYPDVDKLVISKNAALIAFSTISKQDESLAALYAFDTQSEALVFEDHSALHYKQISVDETGTQLAFLFSNDSLTAKYPVFSLALWNKQKKHFKILIDKHIKGMYSHWGISRFGKVYFSQNARRIFLGTARLHTAEPKDTLLEDEKASLNIWSWTDSRLQPQQIKELKKDRERNYLAVYDLDRKIFRQLGDESIRTVKPGAKGNARYAIGYDFTPYQQMQSWKSPVYKDVYLIDLKNGSRNLLCKQCSGNPRISPAGQYVYWFDLEQSEWICYNLKTKQKKRLTHKLPVHFEYEAIDIPREAWAYGAAGWTAEDNHFLVYDQYDVWQLDPDNIEKPQRITLGLGREHHLVYRYLKLDSGTDFISEKPAYFSVFDKETKASGYARYAWKPELPPDLIMMDDARFTHLMKAEDADRFIFSKETFRLFPDIWFSNNDFATARKISNANPQIVQYRWGSEHLISWINHHQDTLQGIVYVPDKLDSSKPSPMLVYFYELNSDLLHRHHIPEPRRSIIDPVYYVSNGYIVFIPDIKYRIGHPGQSALDCVNTGVDKVLETGWVDSTRMGIQGQSWGGYEVAYIITQTHRFAAAMSGAPVSNMTSAYGGIRWASGRSRMFQYENTQSRIGYTLWDSLELYIENSPLFYVPQIETPVLIMHNDHDGAVPWYQGIEFFTALRRNQKKAWMLSYTGEEHNLKRRPNRIDLSIRMQEFFDHYLKDSPMPHWMENGVPAIERNKINGWELLKN